MQRGVSQNTRERRALQHLSHVFAPLRLKTVLCAQVYRPEANRYRTRTQLGEQVAAMVRHGMYTPNQGLSVDGIR